MRMRLPVRWRQREQPAPEPQQFAGGAPTAELRLETWLRSPPAAKEAGLEHWLIRDDFKQFCKFHAENVL